MFKQILKYTWQDILGNRKFCTLFLLNLSIGLLGFGVIDTIKEGFSKIIFEKAKELNASDIRFSSRRKLTDSELKTINSIIPKNSHMQKVVSIYSMIAYKDKNLLVRVNGIEDLHPLYGQFTLQNKGIIKSNTSKNELKKLNTWISKDVWEQLNLGVDEQIVVGGKPLRVDDIILADSSTSFFNGQLAPDIYVGMDFLLNSGLITKGSMTRNQYLYKIGDDSDIHQISQKINDSLKVSDVRVRTYIDKDQPSGRVISYTTDYLGLVSLLSLFLSCLGSSYLFYAYFNSKIKDIGILKSVGAKNSFVISIFVTSLLILAMAAATSSIVFSSILSPAIHNSFDKLFTLDGLKYYYWETALKLIVIAIFSSLFFCLPILLLVKKVSPVVLLTNELPKLKLGGIKSFGVGLLIFSAIYLFSIWQAHSFFIGSIFFFSFIALISLLLVLSYLSLNILKSFRNSKNLNWKLSIANHLGNKSSIVICLVSLSLGITIVQMVHHIKSSIEMEIKAPKGESLPSLFLFDIQEYQLDSFKSSFKKDLDENSLFSPMIRAKFESINEDTMTRPDKNEAYNREESWANNTKNRGVNLSFRNDLAPSETIVEGRNYKLQANDPNMAEITLEKRYADRLKVKIGDVLKFNIQDEMLQGKIVGIRKVKWNSFQPNFFIQFQPGFLEKFPKTYVASLSGSKQTEKVDFKQNIVQKFPNISIIDVEELALKLLDIISKLTYTLSIMAYLCLFAGSIVLYSIISSKIKERVWDLNLLKILGSSRKFLYQQVMTEFGILGVIAALTSFFLAIIFGFIFIKTIFDGYFVPDLYFSIISSIGFIILFIFIALLSMERIIRQKAKTNLDG